MAGYNPPINSRSSRGKSEWNPSYSNSPYSQQPFKPVSMSYRREEQAEIFGFGKEDSPKSNSKIDYFHEESLWRVFIDIISLGSLLGAVLVSYFIMTPFTRGFFCADMTIRYPYKTDTVPTYVAVILSVGTPLCFMVVTELIKTCYFARTKKKISRIRVRVTKKVQFGVYPVIRNIYILAVIFCYGYLTTWILTETSKNFIGRLRPHFLSVCIPSLNCSTVTTLDPFHTYLQLNNHFTCLGSDSSLIREARRSFISGHTSIMFYGCGFLIMYIHAAWSWWHMGVVTHVLQTGLAILASYVGYTRISDFHHHWEDVLAGALVGSLVAFASFRFILNWESLRRKFLPFHRNSHVAFQE